MDEFDGMYRVATDGVGFRVEEFKLTGHLWWRKKRWVPVYTTVGDLCIGFRNVVWRYSTAEEAQSWIDGQLAHLRREANRHKWEPVS